MSYYDNITLTGTGRLGGTGQIETTGSGVDISYSRPIMGAFRSRLEAGNIGNGNQIVVLKIELPRATPVATIAGTSDYPYNSVEIKGTIYKIGSGNASIPQPFYHQYFFSNSEGTNFSLSSLDNYLSTNTVELPYLNNSGNYIILNSPRLSDQNNTVVINWTKTPTTDVLFAKGTYLLI